MGTDVNPMALEGGTKKVRETYAIIELETVAGAKHIPQMKRRVVSGQTGMTLSEEEEDLKLLGEGWCTKNTHSSNS